MVYKVSDISMYETLGRVLDGGASVSVRRQVMIEMNNKTFREYFLVALRAAKYYE